MKKLFLIFFIISISNAQDFEPSQTPITINGNSNYYISSDSILFKQKHFLKGWHWERDKMLTKRMNMNQSDISSNELRNQAVDYADSIYLIIRPDGSSHSVDADMLNARAIQYSPALKIHRNNPEELVTKPNDKKNEVFGFMHILGDTVSDSNSDLYNSLLITGSKVSSLKDSIILSDPWPSNSLNILSSINIDTVLDNYLSRTLYFSINMKKLDNTQLNDSNVLKIELPYSLGYGNISRYIQFDSIPSYNPNDTNQSNRGIYRKLIDITGDTAIYIKRNMLPRNNSNITISGFFRLIKSGDHNDELKNGNPEIDKIDSLKIKITYLGNAEIAINWLRFETPHAQRFLRGYYDCTIINNVRNDLKICDSARIKGKGIKPLRYNLIVEGSLQNWIAERYFNKLIGNIGTNEVGISFPKHYERYVNPSDRWFGLFGLPAHISAPYFKNNIEDTVGSVNGLGLKNGYMGLDSIQHKPVYDSLNNYLYYYNKFHQTKNDQNSNYETHLVHIDTLYPINYFRNQPNDLERYRQVLNLSANAGRGSWLNAIETYSNTFTNDLYKDFIYSDKMWWVQLFSHLWWDKFTYNNRNIMTQTNRPFTGEELRFSSIYPIILGAKGILYDCSKSGGKGYFYEGNDLKFERPKPAIDDWDFHSDSTKARLNLLSDWEYLKDDSVGRDYFRLSGETCGLDTSRIWNLNSAANFLGIPVERIYQGKKSVRIEMRKLHEWITINDSVLMNLKLRSYYAHGYKIWENFHPKYNNNPIRNIVKLDYVKTRKLWNNGFLVPKDEYEPNESSFFDITLLSHTSDPNMNNNFFIGYANRRTNPLILEYDTLKFYSTAEFDEFVVKDSSKGINGTFFPKSYWQYQFWRRAGSRELSIQFAGAKPQDPLYEIFPYYYKIQELGVGTNYFNQDSGFYWTDSLYYHKIDTTVMKYGALKSRLLPGQGKIVSIIDGNIIEKICPPIPIYSCEELLKDISFYVVRDQNIWGDSCKYDLSLIIPQGWQFDSTDIRTIIRTDSSPAHLTFNSTYNYNINQQDSTVYVRLDSIPVNQEIVFGSFYTTCPEHFTVKFHVGKRIMEIFPGCTYDGNFEGDCTCGYQMRSSTNCCDNIDLYAAETTEDGQLSGKFNVFAKQNTTDCAVCEISLVRKFDTKVLAKLTKDKKEKKLNLANFANIGKISMDKSNGRSKDTLFAYIKDKDGKLICKKEIVLETLDWKQGKIIEINEPTESNTTDLSIQYYPNPVEELFNIEVNSEICKKVKVKLLTLKSEELFNIEVKTNALNQFSTEGISNGVYFIKIEDCDSDKFIIKKIVIKK